MNSTEQNLAIWSAVLSDIPNVTRDKIRERIDIQNPPVFGDFMVDLFDHASDEPNPRWLDSKLVVRAVTTPQLCPLPEALRIAYAAARVDSRIDCKILSHLTTPARDWPESASDADVLHVLEVIESISDCERLVLFLIKFVRSPHPHVRSKAVKLLAGACRNPSWATVILSDPDARTRANLMQGLGSQTGAHIEKLLRQGAKDPDPRVALNALLGLSRNGDTQSYKRICDLTRDQRPEFRKAAEWALQEIQSSPFLAMDSEDTGFTLST